MREEIAAAVVFLSRLVRKNDNISKEKIDKFSNHLSAILVEKFKNHWYTEQPTKGQGYRCIRINPFEPIDPILEKAAIDSGLNTQELQLPIELTLWVDPSEVCCRFGESHGSFCTLAESRDGNLQNKAHTINIEELLEKERERHNQQINIVTTRSKGQSHNSHFSRGLLYGGNANFYNKHQHNYYRNKNGTQQQKQPQNVNKNEAAKRESSETTASDRESPEHINEIRQQFLNQVNNVIAGKSGSCDESTSSAMPKSSSSSSTPPPTQETKPQAVTPPATESAAKEKSKQNGENKKEDSKQSHSNASPMQSRSSKGGKNSHHGNNSSSQQQQKNKQNGHYSYHQKSSQHQDSSNSNSSSSSTTNHWNKASTASQGRYQRSQ